MAATAPTFWLYFRTASASFSVMRGLLRTRSSSASVRTTGMRCIVNWSTPTPDTMVSVT